ncbi:hypothetical protein DOTSEDRAFT_132721 [Dothistroma septosporum NZE10]|uniref:Uncharacterized protein n=1 Tax=Dothistroma septosporum (strain NZE10 / CBS 128990) TaxID=675120 RepID=M2YPE7_DOTSN|nr:hypothetical protein DOTSEDRAFT_132721 [Dothistroma septosporum NZE10]
MSPFSSSSITLPALNLTPKKDAATPQKINTPTPRRDSGWIHPRMNEVIRRRNATNFDGSNVKAILISSGLILFSFFVPNIYRSVIPHSWLQAIHPYQLYILWAIDLLFLINITLSAMPLYRKADACEDIPLSPNQRQLLGLAPMSRPATPQEKEQWVTPPRYSRCATPRSTSSSIRPEPSGSPLSGRGTPLEGNTSFLSRSTSGSPFASSTQEQMGGAGSPYSDRLRSGGERRRLSYSNTRSSPLSLSEFEEAGKSAQTPTKGSRASVGLNNKWLYEKGRGSPSSDVGFGRRSRYAGFI